MKKIRWYREWLVFIKELSLLLIAIKNSISVFLAQWYYKWKTNSVRSNRFLLVLCKLLAPKGKKILDNSFDETGRWCSIDMDKIKEFGLAKRIIQDYWFYPGSTEPFLQLLPQLLNLMVADNSELKKLADELFERAKWYEKDVNTDAWDLIEAALITYERASCPEGIKKCANWFHESGLRDGSLENLRFKVDLFIKIEDYDEVKRILKGPDGEMYKTAKRFYRKLFREDEFRKRLNELVNKKLAAN
jgi:hypothetical protein